MIAGKYSRAAVRLQSSLTRLDYIMNCFGSPLSILVGCSEVFRYRAVLMRARFDENKCKDISEGIRLLALGQRELFETKHCQPRTCKF